jgi:hypothetical protein
LALWLLQVGQSFRQNVVGDAFYRRFGFEPSAARRPEMTIDAARACREEIANMHNIGIVVGCPPLPGRWRKNQSVPLRGLRSDGRVDDPSPLRAQQSERL